MTLSIRTFLLVNLLLSVTLIASLSVIGNLFLAHKDIQKQMDAELMRNTERMRAFFSDYRETQRGGERNFSIIQKNLTQASLASGFSPIPLAAPQKPIERWRKSKTHLAGNLEFQIWGPKNHLLLHSKNAPKIPLSNGNQGLSNLAYHDQQWRVHTLQNLQSGLTFMVAEQADHRQRLEHKLSQDFILIMLLTYPFLGLLIWIVVGRGLDTLKKIAHEVRHRAPSYLEPVSLEMVPVEVKPLVVELNQLFSRLHEAFEREKRFTADAAHELRTPLAALNTYTQVALRAKTPEDRKEALLKVLAGVNRGTHVVQQLLTLSRMLPEAPINETNTVDLNKEAMEIAAQLAPEAIAKHIELELVAPTPPVVILGNTTAIGILIRNLVDNAIRYSPEQSTVTIKIESTDKNVVLHVIDNGPGIPEELRDRVFERFFRVMGSQASGSGLGLSIVHQIAKLHHAHIELTSAENGRGLDFKVIFPLLSPESS